MLTTLQETDSVILSHCPNALKNFTAHKATTLLLCSRRFHSRKSIQHRIKADLLPPLDDFISIIFEQASLPPSVIIAGLIYLDRLKHVLPNHAQGDMDTPYRLFLAAILTASKFLSESCTCLTSQMLSYMTESIYSSSDINEMERSFLQLVKYNLYITVQDVKHYLLTHGQLLQMNMVSVNKE